MDHDRPDQTDLTEAYLRLLTQHDRWLAALVYRLVPRAADADDILQEVKVTIWKHFGKFEQGTNFRASARRIATNQLLNHRRAEKRRANPALEESFIEAVAAEIDRRADVLDERAEALRHSMHRLKEGKGMNLDTGGTVAGQEPSRGTQPVLESGGWTAIPTAFGRGKDTTVRRGDQGAPFGGNPLIPVKHLDLAASRKNERRGFLTFDGSQFGAARVKEAQLVLVPQPSGLGFSALVPDSRFAMNSVTDDALDAWDEGTLRWDAAPGCMDEGLVPETTRKLGEFSIPRGGVSGSITIGGEVLAEFVRGDANGLVTFIIVRETGETDPSGLVHVLASREHPTANPPTLRLK